MAQPVSAWAWHMSKLLTAMLAETDPDKKAELKAEFDAKLRASYLREKL